MVSNDQGADLGGDLGYVNAGDMGRLGAFVVLAVLQALLVSLGDLFYLGIQCVHPVMFVLTCCLTSIVFVNITYSLTVSFGDVGKAICVFLLVIQVAGAGGTFPKEMLPDFFQACYPFLPFVHVSPPWRGDVP